MMHLKPRSGTPSKKLASVLHPVVLPKKYLPDPNGYFVCEDNKLITNTALCLRYRSVIPNDLGYNNKCAQCTIDLNVITSKPITLFEELSSELQALLYVKPQEATVKTRVSLC